jgi:hypothetical protein
MANMSEVVHQLKKERERAQKQVQRIDAALAALGSVSPNGSSHHVRCRSAENQSGTESAMGEDEGSQAKANNLSGRAQADRGGAESKMGEGEEGGVGCLVVDRATKR